MAGAQQDVVFSPQANPPSPGAPRAPVPENRVASGLLSFPEDDLGSNPSGAHPAKPSFALVAFPSERCTVKGCVFPAMRPGSGTCAYHDRQQFEPALFESFQPSILLLEQAKFNLPPEEIDDTRALDRRRLVAEREAFLLEEIA